MKKNLTLISTLFFCLNSHAQSKDVNIHTSTTSGNNSRYEIIQSTLAARWTFRVDKVCGNISQMVLNKDEELIWQQMVILGLPKCTQDGKNRYQVFTSGIATRHTFLMNTESGKTWQVRSMKDKDGDEFSAWFAIEN